MASAYINLATLMLSNVSIYRVAKKTGILDVVGKIFKDFILF